MFREMRRFKQQLTDDECKEILKKASTGVLGVNGDDGYPYTVPVNFVYSDNDKTYGKITFHGAKVGHKIDSVKQNDKVSFCVIDRDEVMPKERTTKYCSVIVFGKARILEDEQELREAANSLGAKYSSGYEELYMQETEETIQNKTLCCVEIAIEHMTGKIGRELLLEREKHS